MMLLPLLMAVHAVEDDSGLVARMQRRDPQALAELYDRYGRLVYGLILRVVRDTGIAEDLVQETFLRVWNRAAGFDSDRGAVARNRAIDYVRGQGKRAQSTVEFLESEHPSLFADLRNDVVKFDTIKHVKTALGRLQTNQREAIEMAY